MAEADTSGQFLFEFEARYQAEIRVRRDLALAETAQDEAVRAVGWLHVVVQAAGGLNIFEVRKGAEHVDLVNKFRLMWDRIAILDAAIGPAKQALEAWREHY